MKPDNIGFTEDMKLKLFDFGLMACVRRPALVSDLYQMSGYTGSPRYMAPEVRLFFYYYCLFIESQYAVNSCLC